MPSHGRTLIKVFDLRPLFTRTYPVAHRQPTKTIREIAAVGGELSAFDRYLTAKSQRPCGEGKRGKPGNNRSRQRVLRSALVIGATGKLWPLLR